MGQNYKHSKLRLSELQLEDSVIWEEAEPTNAALESSTLRHYWLFICLALTKIWQHPRLSFAPVAVFAAVYEPIQASEGAP